MSKIVVGTTSPLANARRLFCSSDSDSGFSGESEEDLLLFSVDDVDDDDEELDLEVEDDVDDDEEVDSFLLVREGDVPRV